MEKPKLTTEFLQSFIENAAAFVTSNLGMLRNTGELAGRVTGYGREQVAFNRALDELGADIRRAQESSAVGVDAFKRTIIKMVTSLEKALTTRHNDGKGIQTVLDDYRKSLGFDTREAGTIFEFQRFADFSTGNVSGKLREYKNLSRPEIGKVGDEPFSRDDLQQLSYKLHGSAPMIGLADSAARLR